MPEPDYVQRLIARTDLFTEVINAMTVPEVKLKYLPNSLSGKTPCAVLHAGGTQGERDETITTAPAGVQITVYEFRVSLLALWSDKQADNTPIYYEDAAADQIDCMSDELLQLVRIKKKVKGKWQNLQWFGVSVASDLIKIDGTLYLHELVLLRMTNY
jgi:hypothetical protein